jgi:signal transduction histidine kinase
MKPHIFEMFYTGKNTVADSRRSFGIGLTLCKSIVELHGGTLTLTDNVPHVCNSVSVIGDSDHGIPALFFGTYADLRALFCGSFG